MKNIYHHKIIDIILMILFPRVGEKGCYFSSMPEGHNTFSLMKKYSKTDHRELMDTKSKQESITQDKVERLNYSSDFYNQTNSLRSDKSDYLTKSSNNSLRLTQPRSFSKDGAKEISNIHSTKNVSKSFSQWLGRVGALIVSLLFSYLTVTPAFGQEPVGLSMDTLSVIVKSHTTHQMMEAVEIYELGVGRSAFTNQEGVVKLPVVKADGRCVIRMKGYKSDTVQYIDAALQKGKTVVFLKRDVSHIPALHVGDELPEAFWNQLYPIMNHMEGRTAMTLAEVRDYPIIALDFWSVACAPCIRSIDYLDSLQRSLSGEMYVLPVYVGNATRAPKLMADRGWSSPSLYGEAVNDLNAYFFNQEQFGGLVLIKNGKVFAMPKAKELTADSISKIVKGQVSELPLNRDFVKLIHSPKKK